MGAGEGWGDKLRAWRGEMISDRTHIHGSTKLSEIGSGVVRGHKCPSSGRRNKALRLGWCLLFACRAKMSARMRERWQDPEYREEALKKLNESRAMQTEETRRKISERMKRVWEETRHSGNRTVTDETRRKISETLKVTLHAQAHRHRRRWYGTGPGAGWVLVGCD